MHKFVRLLTASTAAVLAFAPLAFGVTTFEIEGVLLDEEGNAISGSHSVWVDLRAESDPTCVLYRERFSNVEAGSSGSFVLTVGTGIPTAPAFNVGLYEVLKNGVQQACYDENGNFLKSYTPGENSVRSLSVKVELSGGQQIDVGSMVLGMVPYAFNAQQVGKHSAGSLLRVEDYGVPQNAPALTSSEANELKALASGTSNQYVKRTADGGVALPAYNGTPATPSAGSMWFDVMVGELKYYDGTSVKSVGSGNGTGTVTSITAGAGLTGGTITTSGTIALQDIGTPGTYVKVVTDAKGRVVSGSTKLDETDLPDQISTPGRVSGNAITSGTIGGDTSIATTGSISAGGILTKVANAESLWLSSTGSAGGRVEIRAPYGLSNDYILTLPKDAGAPGAVLSGDGGGNLSWTEVVRNGGGIKSIQAGAEAERPEGEEGLLYVALDTQKIYFYNSTAWELVAGAGVAGVITDVIAEAPLTVTTGATPQISMPPASATADGYLSKADWSKFNSKLSQGLPSGQIFVGNSSNVAAAVTPSGDVMMANTGEFTVARIRGQNVSTVAPAAGQVLRWDGSEYLPSFLSLADVRSRVVPGNTVFPSASCGPSQTLTWSSVTDTFTCVNISIAASQVTGLGPLATKSAVDLGSSDATGTLAAARFPALTGDVMTSAGSLTTTVTQVGGVAASDVASGANLANAATSGNIPNAIVRRDASGNFVASTVSATTFLGQALRGGAAAGSNLILESTSNVTKGSVILQPSGGRVGIGTSAPVAKLDVAGGVKLSDESAECNSATAGTIRWNGSAFLGCDGTNWVPLTGITRCPDGFLMVGAPGRASTYCIDRNERGQGSFSAALSACANLNVSVGNPHLCTFEEWYIACKMGSGLNNMKDNYEWVIGSDYNVTELLSTTIAATTVGRDYCEKTTTTDVTDVRRYRCCIR